MMRKPERLTHVILVPLLRSGALCLCVPLLMAQDATTGVAEDGWKTTLEERFSGEVLDSKVWKETVWHDFQKRKVDLSDYTNPEGKADRRVRMRAATRGTDDKTVKFQGIRSVEPVVDLSLPTEVSFDVDWNNQANGCYLDAGMYLCPAAMDTHPRDHEEWFRMIYVGVPPGQRGRGAMDKYGRHGLRRVYTEGWPNKNRGGRPIGLQKVRMVFEPGKLTVYENGKLYFKTEEFELPFTKAYLYLQMKSHSNYPERTLYFDNVVVKQKKTVEADASVGEGDAQEDAGEKDTEPGQVGGEGVEQATEEVKEQQGGDAPQLAP